MYHTSKSLLAGIQALVTLRSGAQHPSAPDRITRSTTPVWTAVNAPKKGIGAGI
jgi:hypothetical protein